MAVLNMRPSVMLNRLTLYILHRAVLIRLLFASPAAVRNLVMCVIVH